MKLKVCGMRDKNNILEVAALCPDYMGFIFYKGSKRFVGDDFVMPVLPASIVKVGVFVNEGEERVSEVVKKYELDLVQLHGEESPEFCERLSKKVKVMKAFGVDENFDFFITKKYDACSFFLFDTASKEYGGTGKKYDRGLLERYEGSTPYFISGGIGLEEISTFAKATADKKQKQSGVRGAYGWDVNSRFESSPGIKNIDLLKQIA